MARKRDYSPGVLRCVRVPQRCGALFKHTIQTYSSKIYSTYFDIGKKSDIYRVFGLIRSFFLPHIPHRDAHRDINKSWTAISSRNHFLLRHRPPQGHVPDPSRHWDRIRPAGSVVLLGLSPVGSLVLDLLLFLVQVSDLKGWEKKSESSF